MERGEWTKCECGGCKKSFELQPAAARLRKKKAKDGQVYCSRKCVHVNKRPKIRELAKCVCGTCKKDFELQTTVARHRTKLSKDGRIYCGRICARSNKRSDTVPEASYGYRA
jgi:hypothetical protein